MFGGDLLVAPVLSPGVNTWTLYLPPAETWVHAWSGDEYTFLSGANSSLTIPAVVGNPPVFYRKNSQYASLFGGLVQHAVTKDTFYCNF